MCRSPWYLLEHLKIRPSSPLYLSTVIQPFHKYSLCCAHELLKANNNVTFITLFTSSFFFCVFLRFFLSAKVNQVAGHTFQCIFMQFDYIFIALTHIYQHSAVSGGMHLQLSFEGKGMKRGQQLIYIRKMRMGDEGTMSGG